MALGLCLAIVIEGAIFLTKIIRNRNRDEREEGMDSKYGANTRMPGGLPQEASRRRRNLRDRFSGRW